MSNQHRRSFSPFPTKDGAIDVERLSKKIKEELDGSKLTGQTEQRLTNKEVGGAIAVLGVLITAFGLSMAGEAEQKKDEPHDEHKRTT